MNHQSGGAGLRKNVRRACSQLVRIAGAPSGALLAAHGEDLPEGASPGVPGRSRCVLRFLSLMLACDSSVDTHKALSAECASSLTAPYMCCFKVILAPHEKAQRPEYYVQAGVCSFAC